MLGQWNEEKLHIIAKSFGITCSNGGDLVDDDFPRPVIQIDIHADMPWVLDEKQDFQ